MRPTTSSFRCWRLASPACWSASGALAAALLDRTLVLLADHELATSTLAVRITGSTWTGPYPAFAAGLATVQGALHGGAGRAGPRPARRVRGDRRRRRRHPAAAGRRAAAGLRAQDLPGRGPAAGAAARGRRRCCPTRPAGATSSTTCSPRRASASRVGRTSTSGVGALAFVGGLPADVPLFAVARIAGFAAHLDEELQERPLRYRGLARPPRPDGQPGGRRCVAGASVRRVAAGRRRRRRR